MNRFFISFLIALFFGAVISAPKALAYSGDSSEDFPLAFENVCDRFNLDISDCSYIGFYTVRNNSSLDVAIFVYPNGTVPSIGLEPERRYGDTYKINVYPTNGYVYDGSRNTYTSLNETRNFSIPCALIDNSVVDFPCPALMYGNYDVSSLSDVYYYVANYWPTVFDSLSAAVSYSTVSSPVTNKASFPIYKTLYSQYMLEKGLTIDSAFLADNNFNVVLQLPIVTSYSELDSDYVGFYCLSTVNTYTFKFELARTPGYIPSTEYFDTYLIIGYTLPSNTQCTCYFGTVSDFFHPFCFKRDDANQYITFTDFQEEERFAVSDTIISGFSVSASSGGNSITGAYTGIKWRVQNPFIEVAPLYLSFIYVNEDNGVIEDGDGSDDYDGFKNTFINTVTFSSYKSVSVSAPTYDGSYDITYDSNFLYLMDKIFNVSFITSMVVGVLAVSMACYIVFGKML